MKLLVNNPPNHPATADFIQPRSFNRVGKTTLWAADNDAYNAFSEGRFMRMLDAIAESPAKPRFVTVPDVVGDHLGTLHEFDRWIPRFTERGIPAAFVLQNGIEEHADDSPISQNDWRAMLEALPWHMISAIFIGGDNSFKFSQAVRELVGFARGSKWIHMGRVNSVRRLNYARMIGCDSCDGSGMARYRRRVLVPMLQSLNQHILHLP